MSDAAIPPSASRSAGFAALVAYFVLLSFALVVLLPLFATLLGGLKSLGDLRTNPIGLPRTWHWENYGGILFSRTYWVMLKNSMIIASLSVFLTVVLSSMIAFAFAQFRFFGARMLMGYLLVGLMFPSATAVVPLFVLLRDLGLVDTYLAIIIPKVAAGLSVGVVLFVNYFRKLPSELFEAAAVDGCGYARFYFSIVMPLSGPIIATTAIVNFVATWNMYLMPLILLTSPELYTWPLGLMDYAGSRGSDWNLICAFVTLTMLPTVIVFLLAQKQIVAGLTSGAVKA